MAFQIGDRVRIVSVNARFHGSALKDRRGTVTATIPPGEGIKAITYEVNLGDQHPRRYFQEQHLRLDA
jgi:hypothetical protein